MPPQICIDSFSLLRKAELLTELLILIQLRLVFASCQHDLILISTALSEV